MFAHLTANELEQLSGRLHGWFGRIMLAMKEDESDDSPLRQFAAEIVALETEVEEAWGDAVERDLWT